MHLLVGSAALNFWCPSIGFADFDVFTDDLDGFLGGVGVDKVVVRNRLRCVFVSGGRRFDVFVSGGGGDSVSGFIGVNGCMPCLDVGGVECRVAGIESLFALKRSHRFWPIGWFKTIRDYHCLKRLVCLDDVLLGLSDLRARERGVFRAKLGMSNDEFFAGSQGMVNRVYDHDSVHEAVSFYGVPLFMRCKRDLSLASLDRDLFDELSFVDKCRLVMEEAFVIALERYVIPSGVDGGVAFRKALRRICTTLTSGWFREFAVEHYFDVLKCDWDFVGRFNSAVTAGKVRLYGSVCE